MPVTTFANTQGKPLLPSEALGAIVTAALVVSRGDPAEAAEYAARTMAAQVSAHNRQTGYGHLGFGLQEDIERLALGRIADGPLPAPDPAPPPANDAEPVPDFTAAKVAVAAGLPAAG